jgi:hypothetical protein
MTPDLVGTIEPDAGSLAGKNEWIALIGIHSALALHEPKQGVNPFTRTPMSFKPHPDAARVVIDGTQVGSIHWAMDDSRRLVVWAEPAAKSRVVDIANDVASKLGWRFVDHEEA